MSNSSFLFEYLKAITFTKKNFLLDPNSEGAQRFSKDYSPFMIGGLLAGCEDHDTIMLANEVNSTRKITPERHFVFLLHTVKKQYRYLKWVRKNQADKTAQKLAIYYEVSLKKAKEYLLLHTEEQIREISEIVGSIER